MIAAMAAMTSRQNRTASLLDRSFCPVVSDEFFNSVRAHVFILINLNLVSLDQLDQIVELYVSVEFQPPFFKGWFTNHHFYGNGLSSSKKNHVDFQGIQYSYEVHIIFISFSYYTHIVIVLHSNHILNSYYIHITFKLHSYYIHITLILYSYYNSYYVHIFKCSYYHIIVSLYIQIDIFIYHTFTSLYIYIFKLRHIQIIITCSNHYI